MYMNTSTFVLKETSALVSVDKVIVNILVRNLKFKAHRLQGKYEYNES